MPIETTVCGQLLSRHVKLNSLAMKEIYLLLWKRKQGG